MKKTTTLLTAALLGFTMIGAGQIASANAGDETNPLTLDSSKEKTEETSSSSTEESSTETSSTEESSSDVSETETSSDVSSTESSSADPNEAKPDELPETGDNTKLVGGIALGASSALLLTGLVLRKKF